MEANEMKDILLQIQADMAALKQGQDVLTQDMSDLKLEVSNLKQGQKSMQDELTKVRLTQENDVLPGIKLLAEGHEIIRKDIKDITEIPQMKDDIDTIQLAVSSLARKVK